MDYFRKTLAFHENDPDEKRAFQYLEKCPYHATDVVTALINDLLLEYGISDPTALSREEAMTMFKKRKKITAMDLIEALKKSSGGNSEPVIEKTAKKTVEDEAPKQLQPINSPQKQNDEYVDENLANMMNLFG